MVIFINYIYTLSVTEIKSKGINPGSLKHDQKYVIKTNKVMSLIDFNVKKTKRKRKTKKLLSQVMKNLSGFFDDRL